MQRSKKKKRMIPPEESFIVTLGKAVYLLHFFPPKDLGILGPNIGYSIHNFSNFIWRMDIILIQRYIFKDQFLRVLLFKQQHNLISFSPLNFRLILSLKLFANYLIAKPNIINELIRLMREGNPFLLISGKQFQVFYSFVRMEEIRILY